MSALLPIVKGEFGIVPEVKGNALAVKVSGSCDSLMTPLLDRFLGDLHNEACRIGVKQVSLDCESLYFMNSAAVKAFVTWLMKVRSLVPAERYGVTIRTNRRLAWHERSFGSILRSAPDVLTIDS